MSFQEDKAALNRAIDAKTQQVIADNEFRRTGLETREQSLAAYRRRRELDKLVDERDELIRYSDLGQQYEKAISINPVTAEDVGVKGAIRVPAATTYDDSQTSLTEVAAYEGDLANATKSQNIEICGFLGDLPDLGIDPAAPQLGIPALQDLAKAINGVTLSALEFAAKPIVDIVGGASKAIGDLASAIQSSVPTVTCGAQQPDVPAEVAPNIGSALSAVPPAPPAPAVPSVGVTPTITITSPSVTVQSLNDVLDAGEI